jgi:hypothetical protein
MLGYGLDELQDMINAVEAMISTLHEHEDPDLYTSLVITKDFLGGLWAEGYFD